MVIELIYMKILQHYQEYFKIFTVNMTEIPNLAVVKKQKSPCDGSVICVIVFVLQESESRQ